MSWSIATSTVAVLRSRFCRLLPLIAVSLLLLPQAAQAQSPAAAPARSQIEDLLEKGSERDGELRRFYAQRGWRPLWIEQGKPSEAADKLLGLVENADADGVSRTALRVAELAVVLRRAHDVPDSKTLAAAEVALSRTFAAYVRATRLSRGSGMDYQNSLLAPVVPSVSAALASAAAAPSLARYLDGLEWMHPLYGELRSAMLQGELTSSQQRLVWLNLERVRALSADPAPKYVLIDAAGARLWMYENGKPVDSMKVVVGKPDQATPMIAGTLTNAVLNPYWNVPLDIVRNRIAANVLKSGLSYLSEGGYQVLSDFSDNPQLVDPATVDWTAVAEGRSEVRVRQLPGDLNFMGEVKYNFPNPDGIYLHDTPEKALLKADVRTASAGCVRLEDAARLGRWLFGRSLTAVPGIAEQVVPLAEPVPVYITYLTAAPDAGKVVFRNDVYQRDAAQLALLFQG